jgi:hypothetical protein
MSSDHSNSKQEIIERIKSMVFLCMYCDSHNPIVVSVVDYEHQGSEALLLNLKCSNATVASVNVNIDTPYYVRLHGTG